MTTKQRMENETYVREHASILAKAEADHEVDALPTESSANQNDRNDLDGRLDGDGMISSGGDDLVLSPLETSEVAMNKFEHEEAISSYVNDLHHQYQLSPGTSGHISMGAMSELTGDQKLDDSAATAAAAARVPRRTMVPTPEEFDFGADYSFHGSILPSVEGYDDDADNLLIGDYDFLGRDPHPPSTPPRHQDLENSFPVGVLVVDSTPSSFDVRGSKTSQGSAYDLIFSRFGLAPGDNSAVQKNHRQPINELSPGRTSQTESMTLHGEKKKQSDPGRHEQEKKSRGRKARGNFIDKPPSVLATRVWGPLRLDCLIAVALLVVVATMGAAIAAALAKGNKDDDEATPAGAPNIMDSSTP